MAFDPASLRKMGYTTGAPRGFDRRIWCYVDIDDTLASISSPGFFNDPACNLVHGDWLFAQGTDGWQIFTVISGTTPITLGLPQNQETDQSDRIARLERLVFQLWKKVRRLEVICRR